MAINEGLSTGELLGKMIMEYKQKPRPGITYFIDDDLKEMNSIKQKKGTKK